MSESDDSILCGGVGEISSGNKTCTSRAQKVEQKDGACEYVYGGSGDNSGGDTDTNTDIVAHEKHTLGSNNDSDVDLSGALEMQLNLRSSTTTKNNDKVLFQDPPPPKEECPICMLLLPHANGLKSLNSVYQPCCGKVICCGCTLVAVGKMHMGELKRCCPFCRLPNVSSDKELVQRMEKRTKMNDANACCNLGCGYRQEFWGLTRNVKVELELLNKAVELGNLEAHLFIATAYQNGDSVEKDMEKAIYHWELAAIGGHEIARHNLGWAEQQKGNMQRAMKHHMISARGGYDDSLKQVGIGYKRGYVTKDEYASTLRAYQSTLDKMRSEQRTLSAQFTSKSVVG